LVWDTYCPGKKGLTLGPSGATTNKQRAVQALGEALRNAPAGASSVVFTVELDPIGTARYVYGEIVSRATHDPGTGCVVWGTVHRVDRRSVLYQWTGAAGSSPIPASPN
jgi:hypothetical protein